MPISSPGSWKLWPLPVPWIVIKTLSNRLRGRKRQVIISCRSNMRGLWVFHFLKMMDIWLIMGISWGVGLNELHRDVVEQTSPEKTEGGRVKIKPKRSSARGELALLPPALRRKCSRCHWGVWRCSADTWANVSRHICLLLLRRPRCLRCFLGL